MSSCPNCNKNTGNATNKKIIWIIIAILFIIACILGYRAGVNWSGPIGREEPLTP